MKAKTLALVGLLAIGLMATMPNASAATTLTNNATAAADCDPNDPVQDWALCVVREGVTVPPWVGQIVSDALQTVRNVEARACSEYERLTGEACPL